MDEITKFGEKNQIDAPSDPGADTPEQDIADRLEAIERKITQPKKQNKWARVFWMTLRTYVFLFSAVGFALFIWEEALQTGGFSGFAYSNSKDWTGLDQVTIPVMKTALAAYAVFVFNPVVMILNPLMTPAYRAYYYSAEAQIKSYESRVFYQK